MAPLAQKLPSCVALVAVCCFILVSVLVLSQGQWQKVLIKHINTEQSVQNLEDYRNRHPGKSTSEEDTENSVVKGHTSSFKRSARSKFQGQKLKLIGHTQAGHHPLWDNTDDFWNMTYEERSKVTT